MTTRAAKRARAARREAPTAEHIPYEGHLDRTIVDTTDGDLVCVLRVVGATFECADSPVLSTRHSRLNRIIMGLSDPRIAVWQQTVRRPENTYPEGEYPPGYAREFNERYKANIESKFLLTNELYTTVVLRRFGSTFERTIVDLFTKPDSAVIAKARKDQVEEMKNIVRNLTAGLTFYEAEPLQVYERNGVLFSEPASFFQFLVTGRWAPVALTAVPLKYLVSGVRPIFGNESVEIRNPESTHFAAMMGLHAYPADTDPTMLDDLLALPFELVVTQSFQFKTKDAELGRMTRTGGRMEDAGDASTSQIDELVDEKDDLQSRRTVRGAHHFSVLVRAWSPDDLQDNIADLNAVLTDAGAKPAREDLALESAYWAQLPGNFADRPRLSPINSRNFCGFAPLHNFAMGQRTGNHWGNALSMLISSAGTPVYLSLHASDPKAKNGGGKKDVGNVLLLGPTGSGKTAAVAFVLMMLQKFEATSVLFMTDRDTEIAIRRAGGKVYPLPLNRPTGLAPFALDDGDPQTRRHLQLLLRRLVSRPRINEDGSETDTQPLTVLETKQLDGAIESVLRLQPASVRRLGRVLDFLPKGELYERLARWCYSREPGREDGPLAWVFDNPVPTIARDLGKGMITGFDTTAYLDDPELRAPLNMHLLHLSSSLVARCKRFAVFLAEFWKPLGDRNYAAFFKKYLKTVRKKNGICVLDSQSASDAMALPIARTLIESCPTRFLFPNGDAVLEEYTQYLNCSRREWKLIQEELPEGQGMFVLKQGRHSSVVQLPLAGMDDDMAVLSARDHTLELMDRLIAQHGDDPAVWGPHFDIERKLL